MRDLLLKGSISTLALGLLLSSSQAKADENLALIPPSGSTKESRVTDINRCLAIAVEIARLANLVTPFERVPLKNQATGGFLFSATLIGPRPAVDADGNPTRAGSALGINWGQSAVSDRYVVCLLGKGYSWPTSVSSSTGEQSQPNLTLEQETKILYEAGRLFRYRGLAQEGERLLRRVVEIDEKRLPDEHPIMIQDLGELAIALFDLKRTDDGLVYVNRLLANAHRSPRQLRNFQAWIFENYAQALSQQGNAEYPSKLLTMAKQLRNE